MKTMNEDFLNGVLSQMITSKHVYSTVLCVQSGNGSLSWTGAAGSMEKGSPMAKRPPQRC